MKNLLLTFLSFMSVLVSAQDVLYKTFIVKINSYLESSKIVKYDELGNPDLSLVTIKQFAKELKKRKNLSIK